jgi:hypothetical protein
MSVFDTKKEQDMWTHEASIETTASTTALWKIFADVPGWKRWNAGIERIVLMGDFASGNRFVMQPPGQEAFISQLRDVVEEEGFTDETVIDGTRVLVSHRLLPLAWGGSKVVYRTEIEGPNAAEFGPLVTGDFDEILSELKALAEAS